jgi:hypothetical protein
MNTANPVFSHQSDVVWKLKTHFPKIVVLTGERPEEQISELKIMEYQWQEGENFQNALYFYRALIDVLIKFRPNIVFSHMTEVQSALAAPILKLFRIRHILWYAHRSNSMWLKFARFFCNGIVSSTIGSIPITGKKIHLIGQGVDINLFRQNPKRRDKAKFLHIGRNDASKNLLNIVTTLLNYFPEERVLLNHYGKSFDINKPGSENYHLALDSFVSKNSWVTVNAAIKREHLRQVFDEHDVFIHSFQGSLDKILIEAVLAGIPVVTINQEFIDVFGAWGEQARNPNLGQELGAFLSENEYSIIQKCIDRQNRAINLYGLDAWTERLVKVLSPKVKM